VSPLAAPDPGGIGFGSPARENQMNISINAVLALLIAWAVFTTLVTLLTARAARRRVGSPGLVTLCVALLGLFPPLNLLALTFLAMLPIAARDGQTPQEGDAG